jgi:hypothetical protein
MLPDDTRWTPFPKRGITSSHMPCVITSRYHAPYCLPPSVAVQVHGRISDIWRSYVSQRLLWDVGYHIAFSTPMVDQLRSPHNYLADMQVSPC